MNVYEYGAAHPRALLMFQCTAEPWWALEPAAKCLARQMDGMAHGELAMVHPERLYAEATRFLAGEGAKCNMEQADERDRPARRLGQTFMI